MKHHTKIKGDIGVSKCISDLTEKEYVVSLPLTEHAPFDIIAYKNGVCKTIQVKYREIRNGALNISFRSSWADKNGSHVRFVDKSLIDYYCVYCPNNNKCYYFDPKLFGKNITLRVNETKNNQENKINLAKNYEHVPF